MGKNVDLAVQEAIQRRNFSLPSDLSNVPVQGGQMQICYLIGDAGQVETLMWSLTPSTLSGIQIDFFLRLGGAVLGQADISGEGEIIIDIVAGDVAFVREAKEDANP